MSIYTQNDFPVPQYDIKGNKEPFSVDVFTCDKDGMINTGWYNFDTEMWSFHGETLVDPYEFGKIYDFVWMYKPEELYVK